MVKTVVTALVRAVGIALLVAACKNTPEPEVAASSRTTFASSANIQLRLGTPRVLSRKISLREPLTLAMKDDALVLTFAQRGREGTTLAVDPLSLSERSATPLLFDAERPTPPPYLSREPVRLPLERGWSVLCWTDIDTDRVLAQALDPRGTAVEGALLVVSRPSMDVKGPPRGVTLDARHLLVAFFEMTPEGFELVAAPIEANVTAAAL